MQPIREVLIKDLDEIEDAMSRTANRCDIWQDRIIYTYGKVLYHILQLLMKGEIND